MGRVESADMDDRVDLAGLLRTEAPHVRLAGLRLTRLVREINEGLAGTASEVIVSTQAWSTVLTFAAVQTENTLTRLGAELRSLAERVLLASAAVRVAEVDRAFAELRARVRELFALRNLCHPARFRDWEQPLVIDARALFADCLRRLGRYCALLAAMILHPDRMGADGEADLGVALDLDLAQQLAAIAARSPPPVPLWRYY